MAGEISETKAHELHFIELVYSFQQLAMIALGKLVNPASQQVERQLAQAQSLIDTLRMLKAKTQGNLSNVEAKLLNQVLLDLELNYADEADRRAPSQGESSSTMGPHTGTDPAQKPQPPTAPSK